MKHTGTLALCLASVCVLARNIHAQQPPPNPKNEIAWAQEFLRALYSGLDRKNYALTVETYLAYDHPGDNIKWLRMDVGEGPKDWLRGYSGGCLYSITPPSVGWPEEWGPPPPSVMSPSPKDEHCKQGPMYPKQFLTAGFQFDKESHLTNFGAEGSFINDGKANDEVYAIVHAHPTMTYAEIVATMKQHGTKYGPDDKEQFIKDLPLKQLEPFLGKLQIISVGFHEIEKDPDPAPWIGSWPDWTVKAQATTKDGDKVPYEMHFNHLRGYLTGLLDCRASPWCNRD